MTKSTKPKVAAETPPGTKRVVAPKAAAEKAAAEKSSDAQRNSAPRVATETARRMKRAVAPKAAAETALKAAAEKSSDVQRNSAPKVATETARDAQRQIAPKAAAEKSGEPHRELHRKIATNAVAETTHGMQRQVAAPFDGFRTPQVPASMRALAERSVAQTRELFERSANALKSVLESWETSLDAAGQGTVALNRKIIDIAERNISTGFDLAANLAGAKSLAEAMEVQAAYWRKQLGDLSAQAEEVRALSTKVTADLAEPIRAQVTRMEESVKRTKSTQP
jgi:phasin